VQVSMKFEDHGVIERFKVMPIKLDAAVRKGVQRVSGEAQRDITGKKGLGKYDRHPAGTKTPSPVGEPPAQITSSLRRSVVMLPIKRVGFASYTQTTLPTMIYARVQEFGSSRIPARPFVAPARKDLVESGRAKRLFSEQVLKELRKNG